MDLGCYVLNAARQFGRWFGQAPFVVRAETTLKKPDVDAAMLVELAYPGGIPGRRHWDMNAEARQMFWTVTGTAAAAAVPAFAVPHLDNRIVITRDGSTEEQTLGSQTSYTYQLAALADTLETGAEFVIDVDDSVANAELIDEVYRRAGLSPAARPAWFCAAQLLRQTTRRRAAHPAPGGASRYQPRPLRDEREPVGACCMA